MLLICIQIQYYGDIIALLKYRCSAISRNFPYALEIF